MSRFATLLRREWMQHHKGYLALMAAPPLLLLLVIAFAPDVQVQPRVPDVVMAVATVIVTVLVMAIGWIAMVLQMPGLARRDQQDRSIEFWLSLPVGHSKSIGATLLFHALLMPLLALAIGWLFSQVIGLVLVAMVAGAGAWAQLPWAALGVGAVALLLRLALGISLATLWLSPLILLLMVASAAFKRWGLPIVVVSLSLLGLVLRQAYGLNLVSDTVRALGRHAAVALSPVGGPGVVNIGPRGEGFAELLAMFPGMALDSALVALRDVASPGFLAAAAFSAACFAGLVVLRRRNG